MDTRLTSALRRLATHGTADLVTLREADDAYGPLARGERFRHTQAGERARRLLWTVLVDRHQLRPELVSDQVDGGHPDKSYRQVLEQWVSRPEDRKSDVSPEFGGASWPDGAYDWCAIVGATGSGKSVAGRELAHRTGREYVNLDDEVERQQGDSLRNLFDRHGSLKTFQLYRDGVAKWLSEGPASQPLVVAFGAGSVLLPDMCALYLRSRDSIWLAVSPDAILRRLAADPSHSAHAFGRPEYRPLHELVQIARAPVYARAARWVSADASLPAVVSAMMPPEQVGP